MSGLSPGDAAVAVRTFPRRVKEAYQEAGDEPDFERARAEVAALTAVLQHAVTGLDPTQRPGSELDEVAPQLARVIEAQPADSWSEGDRLERLRQAVDTAALHLRQVREALQSGPKEE